MRILWWVIAVPVALLLVMLAVANRDLVTLSLDPVGGSVALPLYLVIFLAFLVGLVCGGVLTWFSGVKRRIRKRKAEREKASGARVPDGPRQPTVPF
ncbi:MAG TPA: LapA family protein [Alphaproteobacteria bacterium]|nr:LapA family protein [Alphaproteobacteria bacterium]